MKFLIWTALLLICGLFNTAKAQRLIALSPHLVELIYELGAQEQLVGVSEGADFPEGAKSLYRVGNYAGINIEAVLSLKPDWVLAWKGGNPQADLDKLTSLGIRVYYSAPQTLDDVALELERLGRLVGTPTKGLRLAADYRAQLNKIRQTYRSKTKISVFYELWPAPLTTIANRAWPQQQLELCGATNPFSTFSGDYPQVNLEQVLMANPQAIIQTASKGQSSADALEWRKWSHLTAVKNQHVFVLDADTLHRMTSRSLVAITQLCQTLDKVRNTQASEIKISQPKSVNLGVLPSL